VVLLGRAYMVFTTAPILSLADESAIEECISAGAFVPRVELLGSVARNLEIATGTLGSDGSKSDRGVSIGRAK